MDQSDKKFNIGIEGFSFRHQNWSVFETITHASTMGFSSVSFDVADQHDLNKSASSDVLSFAAKYNIKITIAAPALVPLNFEQTEILTSRISLLTKYIDIASYLESPIMRTYILNTDSKVIGSSQGLEYAAKVLKIINSKAQKKGVQIAIENHRDYRSYQLKKLLNDLSLPNIRICFDISNQLPLAEDPINAYQLLKPYIIMVHLKDMVMRLENDGFWWRSVPLGLGNLPLKLFVDQIQKDKINNILMEISTSRAPTFTSFSKKDSTEEKCLEFIKKYAKWPDEVDSYLNRSESSMDLIAQQDLVHIQQSLNWYKENITKY